jgi:SAM-dependent methyltransferase
MTADSKTYAPAWLSLREGADADARATAHLEPLRAHLGEPPVVIRDLGCGTGSMGRWLAPRLPGAQHWVMLDRDPLLLAHAAADPPGAAADGAPVTVETRRADVANLGVDDLTGAGLVTASALLDLLTREEVEALAAACSGAGCAALLTLSVRGEVQLTPDDPLDAAVASAFNAHQRRTVEGRRLLGPDAVPVAAEAFARHGAAVRVRAAPWRLGPERAALVRAWLLGWVGAAVEERPDLSEAARAYLDRRLAETATGALRVMVAHDDLLVLP